MPEESLDTGLEMGGEEGAKPAPKPKRKKKKTGKWTWLLLLLVLLVGAGAGLHIAGAWDARPLLYSVTPKIPWVGENIAKFVGIPEEYSLTVEQRRRLELQRWSEQLADRERSLREKETALSALSADLGARSLALERQEAELALEAPIAPPKSQEEEEAYVDMLMKTFQEISPRRAALIVEQLREDLAVQLLAAMPQDARASILGRMEAAIAARLTERLAAGGSR